MSWSFAIINNRLAEVFFERRKGKVIFEGHCYVKKEEYKTKQEQTWIKGDTEKVRLVYRDRKYRRIK